VRFDLDDGKINQTRYPNDARVVSLLTAGLKRLKRFLIHGGRRHNNCDFHRPFDDVCVGHNISVGINNHSRAD
jgi:hypothetical protein